MLRFSMASLPRPRRRTTIAVALMGVCLLAAAGEAQFRRGGRQARTATAADFDGAFHFCRAWFRSDFRGDGGNWSVDYPKADVNLSIRLGELTKIPISHDGEGYPNHLIVRLTDDELYECPFIMMTEVGSALFDDKEAARLRDYLLKGGFLWVDDFWGSYAWDFWVGQFRKVMPAAEYPIIDLPPDHPMFHTQFEVAKVPQIPNIGFFISSGGGTSERGADSAVAHARAVLDKNGRVMVLMTHNTDLGDSWEREGDDPRYFYAVGPNGYAFGINVVLYALTH
jgi:hypothetical protein